LAAPARLAIGGLRSWERGTAAQIWISRRQLYAKFESWLYSGVAQGAA